MRAVLPGALAILTLTGGRRAQAEVLLWNFDGDLSSFTGQSDLVPGAASPAVVPEVTFESVLLGGEQAQAARFRRGTFFAMNFDLPPNGGGRFVNEYTLILDVLFPDRSASGGWVALFQVTETMPTTPTGSSTRTEASV